VTHRRALSSILVLTLLVAAACTRSDDETETGTGDDGTTTSSSPAADATSLDDGGFGDLEDVCSDGDAKGATDTGVTDTQIHVGTFTDKGFEGRPGLTKEMYDAAVAFTKWCNEHGGILGRELVLADLDAKLFEYEARITESCERDFSLVGGGAVFDEDPKDLRVKCGLANIAGYVVSPRGRVAKLQVQPVPNPVYQLPAGPYRRAAELYPDATKAYGVMTGALPSTKVVRNQAVEAVKKLGWTVVYNREYAPAGETGWRNFVLEMRDKGVKILDYIGEPENLATLNGFMQTEGWYPDVILLNANFYDEKYAAEAGDVAGNALIRTAFHPFELADDNKATQDYLDLMEQYNPKGKVASLGAQGISAWLLFATAAAECGSELTRACLLEKAGAMSDWTGGGLHAPQQPGNSQASNCFLLLTVDEKGFAYDRDATKPNNGLYNCDPQNVVTLDDDYGVPKPRA
jgi:hypothetical protein